MVVSIKEVCCRNRKKKGSPRNDDLDWLSLSTEMEDISVRNSEHVKDRRDQEDSEAFGVDRVVVIGTEKCQSLQREDLQQIEYEDQETAVFAKINGKDDDSRNRMQCNGQFPHVSLRIK